MQPKVIVTALIAAFAAAAHAQQVPAVAEKIEVTGSNIKRIDVETPSPVAIITREQIRESGKRDVAELLRTYSAATAGSQLANGSGSFSACRATGSSAGPGSSRPARRGAGRRKCA